MLYPVRLTLEGPRDLLVGGGAVLTRMLSDIPPKLLRPGLPAETITDRIATVLGSEALAPNRYGQEEEALSAATNPASGRGLSHDPAMAVPCCGVSSLS